LELEATVFVFIGGASVHPIFSAPSQASADSMASREAATYMAMLSIGARGMCEAGPCPGDADDRPACRCVPMRRAAGR